jgi:hypothetical protein
MTYTKQELSTWTDSQILEALKPNFDELIECWQGGAHSEVLWNDGYYCEVVSNKLTEQQKQEWFESFCEDSCNEDEHPDFDTLLFNDDYLGEDIGSWWSDKPENKDEFIVFTFKFFLNYEPANIEEVLIPFLKN